LPLFSCLLSLVLCALSLGPWLFWPWDFSIHIALPH
jgi:hypothetical protein